MSDVLSEADVDATPRQAPGAGDGARRPVHWIGGPTGTSHPVIDFLFTYYTLRPAQLARWHPGFGVGLSGPASEAYCGSAGIAGSTTR